MSFATVMEGTMRLVEALEMMETAQEPFTLRFVTVDRKRKTGGKVREWTGCRLSGRQRREESRSEGGKDASTGFGMPAHYANGTRNVVVGNGTQRRKVHIWLLLALNGKKIVLG